MPAKTTATTTMRYWDYDDDEYSGSGFTDTDILKARSWGFKIRNIDSYDW